MLIYAVFFCIALVAGFLGKLVEKKDTSVAVMIHILGGLAALWMFNIIAAQEGLSRYSVLDFLIALMCINFLVLYFGRFIAEQVINRPRGES